MSAGNTILQLLGIAVDLTIILYLRKLEVAGFFELPGSAIGCTEYVRHEPR